MSEFMEPNLEELMRILIDFEFDDKKLFIFEYKGRKCCLAQNLGDVLGYAPRKIKDRLLEWSDELEPEEDIARIVGEELRTLKTLLKELGPKSGPSDLLSDNAPSITLLFRSGIHLVLMKTTKPVGKRVREVLKKEVFPKLEEGYSVEQITTGQLESTDGLFREWIADLKTTQTLPQEVYERLLMSLHAARLKAAVGMDISEQPIQNLLLSPPSEKPVARLHNHQRDPNPEQWRSVGDITRRYGYKSKELVSNILHDLGLYKNSRGQWVEIEGVSQLDMNEEHDQPHLRYHAGVAFVVLNEIWRRSRVNNRMDQRLRQKLDSGDQTLWPMTEEDFRAWFQSVRDRLPGRFIEASPLS